MGQITPRPEGVIVTAEALSQTGKNHAVKGASLRWALRADAGRTGAMSTALEKRS